MAKVGNMQYSVSSYGRPALCYIPVTYLCRNWKFLPLILFPHFAYLQLLTSSNPQPVLYREELVFCFFGLDFGFI